jgi:hypothetical protein
LRVMRRIVLLIFLGLLCCMTACLLHTPEAWLGHKGKNMTVEEIARKAESVYEQALKEGVPKEKALERSMEFVRAQEIVDSVSIAGPNTLKVIFKDGNDLYMLLGRNR